MTGNLARQLVLLVFLGHIAYTDYRSSKIRNRTLLLGLLCGLLLTVPDGLPAVWELLLGAGAGFVVGFIFWELRIFRAGDAKLLCMLGAYAGISGFRTHFAAVFLTAGAFAFVSMLRHGVLAERLKRIWYYLKLLFLERRFFPYPPVEDDPCFLPFGVPVFVGELLLFVLQRVRG